MDRVVTVWIDNPPVNVLTAGTVAALESDLQALGTGTVVAVLRGRGGRAFSAGADLAAIDGDGPPAGIQPLADLIESLPFPVVAAIEGYCLGGGLELALACDLRVAAEAAQLGLPEVGLGLIPGGGGTQRLPRLIGRGRAAWLMMSGTRITASEAAAWGLVDVVTADLEAELGRITAAIGSRSPNALRELKQLLLATRDTRSDEAELEAFARCVASEDGREGVAAFLAKREPRWSGT